MRILNAQSLIFLLFRLGSATPHHRDPTTVITTVTVTVRPGSEASPPAPADQKPTTTLPVSARPEFTSSASFRSIVLNTTNTYRAQHDASPLVYNQSLAQFAEEVSTSCEMKHSGGPFGENLAIGCSDLDGCIELWGNERDEYNFGKGEFSKETGHFTQLVWKNTTAVGCAARFCGDGKRWYLVCEYWPRGNVKGQFLELVAKKVAGKVNVRSEASGVRDGVRRMPVVVWVVMGLVGFAVLMV